MYKTESVEVNWIVTASLLLNSSGVSVNAFGINRSTLLLTVVVANELNADHSKEC